MSNNYYQNPIFPTAIDSEFYEQDEKSRINQIIDKGEVSNTTNLLNDFLKDNIGHVVKVYTSFPNSQSEKIFNGTLQVFEKDFLIINNSTKHVSYLLFFNFINYIEFEDK